MFLRMSPQDILERSLILERSGFETWTTVGGEVATGGVVLTGGTSFWETSSCVTGGTGIGTCLAVWCAYLIDRQSCHGGI